MPRPNPPSSPLDCARPGEVRQGESLWDREEEEEQDVSLYHRTVRYGEHQEEEEKEEQGENE